MSWESEIQKAMHLIAPHLTGNVLDLGSQGKPCVDHAIQMDLERFHVPPHPPVQFVGNAFLQLPFRDTTFSAVVGSHILEDAKDWPPILYEWCRVVKWGGVIVIAVPDKVRFRAAVAAGQPDNLNHKHESYLGELSELFSKPPLSGQVGRHFEILFEKYEPENDYNIIFCARRIA